MRPYPKGEIMPKITVSFVNEYGQQVEIIVEVTKNFGIRIVMNRGENQEIVPNQYTFLESQVIRHCIRLISEPGIKREI